MSRTAHHCPCVSHTVAHCGSCGGCHCVQASADTPLTALRRASVPLVRTVVYACVHVHGHASGFTASGSPRVCGGIVASGPTWGSLRQVCHSTCGEGASGTVKADGGHTPPPPPPGPCPPPPFGSIVWGVGPGGIGPALCGCWAVNFECHCPWGHRPSAASL